MKKKRIISELLIICLIVLLIPFIVSADDQYDIPPSNYRLKYMSYGYSPYVLNVYTSGSPASGDMVTLYSSSGSASQSWKNDIVSISNYEYKIACWYNNSLTLNYNQATTKCTVYPYINNTAADYVINYQPGTYGLVISLPGRSRYLGNSGNYSGAQCYWYLYGSTIYNEDNWVVTNW